MPRANAMDCKKSPLAVDPVSIRPLRRGDRDQIAQLLRSAQVFRREEIDCALELCALSLAKGNSDDEYAIFCAELPKGSVAGFLCYGKTPLTSSTYDLYWIVTHPSHQGRGIARGMLNYLEHLLSAKQATLLVAETSSLPSYEAARAFYRAKGFQEESRIRDFYAPGDDRLTYCKRLS